MGFVKTEGDRHKNSIYGGAEIAYTKKTKKGRSVERKKACSGK